VGRPLLSRSGHSGSAPGSLFCTSDDGTTVRFYLSL
jgi:hypothetical protein